MILWLTAALALAGVEISPPPAVGQTSDLQVTDADGRPRGGLTLRVVHRPGLTGARELGAGITDPRGRARWKPEIGGGSVLYAGDEALARVHVGEPDARASVFIPLGVLLAAALASIVAARRSP